MVKRNDYCICGSIKKYKNCCLNKDLKKKEEEIIPIDFYLEVDPELRCQFTFEERDKKRLLKDSIKIITTTIMKDLMKSNLKYVYTGEYKILVLVDCMKNGEEIDHYGKVGCELTLAKFINKINEYYHEEGFNNRRLRKLTFMIDITNVYRVLNVPIKHFYFDALIDYGWKKEEQA